MLEITRRVQIESDIETVFAVLADIRRRPEWVTSTVRTYDLPTGPLQSSQRFRQSMRVVGRPLESEWSVLDVDPPCRIVYEAMCPAGGHLTMTQNLNRVGADTGVEIMVAFELPPELLHGSLGLRYIERRIAREMAVSLHNLRDLVEEHASSADSDR
jgi:uncharacterized protein YndB with AHSA1/START domain